jgi:ABC-2 type transport system permease protein
MNLRLTLRKLWAFFLRDLAIARGYRSAFLLEILEALFGVATFYYLSRFVESPQLSRALPQGGSYFAFALIGFAFFDYLGVALNAFDSSIEEARQNRTLEALLVTQTSLPVMLLGSVVYPFISASLRTIVYLGSGVALFGFSVHSANWLGAILILLASILAFAGLGIFSTSYLLLFKRGNPAKWILLGLSGLLGGMMYPVSILPDFLQAIARLIPITYSLEGMRAALLGGAGLGQLCPSIFALLIFAAILLPLSFFTFAWALRRTKITGTLTHV